MRIDVPPPRRPPAPLPRQGSLYHEMGERSRVLFFLLLLLLLLFLLLLFLLLLIFLPLFFLLILLFLLCCPALCRLLSPPLRSSLRSVPALPGPAVPPSCEGLLLQDNAVSAEIRALLSSYYSDR